MQEREPLIKPTIKNDKYGSIIINKQPSSTSTLPPSPSSSSSSPTTDTDPDPDKNELNEMKISLNLFEKIGYGLGHVYNDLCAGVWFSYTLLFFQGALLMPGPIAGGLVMLGQVGDAIATPIIGYLTDKYGTKRKWHIFGTFLVFLTFPLIFSLCPWCKLYEWWEPIYFTIIIILFQFAWPIVQITHLSMIPEIARTQKDRNDLTAIRYSGSVCSSVIVYCVTWAVLHSKNKTDSNIGPSDAYRFRDISLILTLIGVSMSVLFHFSLSLTGYEVRRKNVRQITERTTTITRSSTPSSSSSATGIASTNNDRTTTDTERLLPSSNNNNDDTQTTVDVRTDNEQIVVHKNFLKSPQLYQNTLLYVFSRLFMTTSLLYMPLWLDERTWIPTPTPAVHSFSNLPIIIPNKSVEHIATVPLVSFLSSFVSSVLLKYTYNCFGHSYHYFIGSLASIGACVWVALGAVPTIPTEYLFCIAILFGAGSSITMISSLSIIADMIGPNAEQGGKIYSAVTFVDKLITGIAVVVIENLKCKTRNECPEYYRNVLAYGCGVAASIGVLILITLVCTRPRRRQRQHNNNTTRVDIN